MVSRLINRAMLFNPKQIEWGVQCNDQKWIDNNTWLTD